MTSNTTCVSIITVVLNGESTLEPTLRSILNQTYKNIELIVIDGKSTDRTIDIIKKHEKYIDFWVSEKDNGIYDAMNKGIKHAKGEWLIFMNCGDLFHENDIINYCINKYSEADVIFSDTKFMHGRKKISKASHFPLNVIHQSMIYRKNLHNEFGSFIASRNITIADYLFFKLIQNKKWLKSDRIISLYDNSGISTFKEHYYQKQGVELIFNTKIFSRLRIAIILVFYDYYKFIRNTFRKS